MNILPKKRWHVRTKDNIARVRKDEAAAREEDRKKQDKLKLAESEARVNFLRKCSGIAEKHNQEESEEERVSNADACTSRHVDLFSDYKSHIKTTNKELEKEKKEEQEKYEKKIGYLTYLGQDTNEALKLKSWYELAPKRLDVGSERGDLNEKDLKIKYNHDPLTFIKSILPAEPKLATKPLTKRKRSPSPTKHEGSPSSLTKRKKSSSPQLSAHKEHQRKKSKKDKKHKIGKYKKRSKEHKREKSKGKEDYQKLKLLKIEQLRKERLRRETAERARQEALLAPKEPKPKASTESTTKIVQKYNSQFNPELAKQNLN